MRANGLVKWCSTCKVERALEDYHKNRTTADGLHSECRDCSNSRRGQWRKANPERAEVHRKDNRRYYLRAEYGITPEAYDELLRSQGGVCAICRRERQPDERRFPVDHCHETGVVRGVLCQTCNTGLGNFRDNKDFLTRAIQYLSE